MFSVSESILGVLIWLSDGNDTNKSRVCSTGLSADVRREMQVKENTEEALDNLLWNTSYTT